MCRMQDASCVCVCECVCVHRTAYRMYTVLSSRSVLRDEMIGQTGRAGVHAAQPLWLVMMRNVDKCYRVWCVTAYGLPLSTVRRLGGRLHTHVGDILGG